MTNGLYKVVFLLCAEKSSVIEMFIFQKSYLYFNLLTLTNVAYIHSLQVQYCIQTMILVHKPLCGKGLSSLDTFLSTRCIVHFMVCAHFPNSYETVLLP